MILDRLLTYLTYLGLVVSIPSIALAENLSDIPAKKFHLSRQVVSISHLSDVKAQGIVVNRDIALVNDGRGIWLVKAGNFSLERKEPRAVLANIVMWYGPACALNDGFVIAVQDYPEEQRDEENATPDPTANGFVILSASSPDRYLNTLTITSRPPPGPFTIRGSKQFSDEVQSCAWDGRRLVVGSYGSLGEADFNTDTMSLIEEDEVLSLNRFPLLVEAKGIWVGVSEGGLGGATLDLLPSVGKRKQFWIGSEEGAVSVSALLRHHGRLIVGTSHGLFLLDERSGRFWRFDFGKQLANLPVTSLVHHKGFLWVFVGEEWLRVDVRNQKAVRYVDTKGTPFVIGTPFSNGWLLSGPAGVWKYEYPGTGCKMPNPSFHRTCAKSRAGR